MENKSLIKIFFKCANFILIWYIIKGKTNKIQKKEKVKKMKKRVVLSLAVLLAVSSAGYAAPARNSIDASLDAIEAKYDQLLEMEAQRKREFTAEKEQLEKEVEELKGKLVGKEEREEKLKKQAEVRWYRNEYKKVLNNYDEYYKNIDRMIVQKEARIEELTMILSVME